VLDLPLGLKATYVIGEQFARQFLVDKTTVKPRSFTSLVIGCPLYTSGMMMMMMMMMMPETIINPRTGLKRRDRRHDIDLESEETFLASMLLSENGKNATCIMKVFAWHYSMEYLFPRCHKIILDENNPASLLE
jgi:hypothetical protein